LSPSDAKLIRDEAEAAIKEEGWTKEALAKMVKMDSYIRESSRVHPMSLISVGRTAMSDFTFSDGLFIPKGTKICVNTHGRHFDEGFYPNAYAFDGFRFLNKGDPDNQPPAVLPTVDYHAFGYGRPACPGRFFAIVELKLMMAHLLINYDVKLQAGTYPSKLCFETIVIPSRTESILYRKRHN
jgi:cytochrome P450